MSSLTKIREFFQVPQELWTAFTQEAGNPGEDIRLLAALPGPVVAGALTQASLGPDQALTAIQAVQVG